MNHQYFSSSCSVPVEPRTGPLEGAAATLRQWLSAWRQWQQTVAAELHEQRLARGISAAYADLDARTRQDLGIDRRRI